MNRNFVHLHVHSEYSLLDGACRIDRLVEKAAELGQKAIAITDHGVMYGAVEFYKKAKSLGIKPIIGCEIYYCAPSIPEEDRAFDISLCHLVLLCKNNEGYENLIKLVSESSLESNGKAPRVSEETLRKYSGGLICLSGCIRGEISGLLLKNDYNSALNAALTYKEIFGEDNFFIELQDHLTEDQKHILPSLCRVAKDAGVGLVATNDVHYIEKNDAEIHNILLCVQTKTTINQKNPLSFPTEEFWLKSADEMYDLFPKLPEAIENTVKIAERCNVLLEFGNIMLPEFKLDGVTDNISFFKNLCRKGLLEKYGANSTEEASERMERELDVIIKMGYTDYYLIVWDFVSYSKKNGIPVGPGRGSGAASICAYCIGITEIDPIKHSLLFERFLNPERISMPDFDIDFCHEDRQKVIDYVIRRYGRERVSNIIAFDTLKARAAVKDVGRAIDLDLKFCSSVTAMIPKDIDITISRAIERNPDLKKLYDSNPTVKRLLDLSERIEKMPRNITVHAAGIVISALPIMDSVPVTMSSDTVVTQYTAETLENLGLLKMDFLALRNLTVTKHCIEALKAKDPEFDETVPYDDKAVYDMFSEGRSIGVFQFESKGMRSVLKRLKPECIEDLIAVISLYRPGPSESIPKYIASKNDPKSVSYLHPMLEPILNVTYGCIVYQEQVMEIFRVLAGYSYGRADLVRRAMAKKKHDIMERERNSFIYGDDGRDGLDGCCGAVANGISEETASAIFDRMSSFASYAFNKSHAAAYAYLSFKTAYLKCRFFREYMAALMTSVSTNTDRLAEYVEECRANGVTILGPNINKSVGDFVSEGENIRYGFHAVKGLGESAAGEIVKERERGGEYTSLQSFCERTARMNISKTGVENLIKSGAFDGMGANRSEMALNFAYIMDCAGKFTGESLEGQLDLFSSQTEENDDYAVFKYTPTEEYDFNERLFHEKTATGMYISGHPVDPYSDYISLTRLWDSQKFAEVYSSGNLKKDAEVAFVGFVEDMTERTTSVGKKMAFIKLCDRKGSVDATVFPGEYLKYEKIIEKGKVLYIRGRISFKSRADFSIVCSALYSGEDFERICLKKRLCIKLSSSDKEIINAAAALLSDNSGDQEAVFYLTDRKSYLRPKSSVGIKLCGELVKELSRLVGYDKIGLID